MATGNGVHTALVLSGGGAKGAFQLGALEVLAEAGITYTCVAGVSVGALNGTMVASEQLDRLGTIWRTVERADVYRGRWPWVLFNVLRGRKGLYNNAPLLDLIRREVDPGRINIPLEIGVVKLESGNYLSIRPSSPRFEELVFASTSIPIIWPPREIGGESFVDGGLRNITPLADVIDHDPDRIVIITTEPRDKPPASMRPANIIDVAQRSLDILLDETFDNDIRSFLRINRLVEQAETGGVTLRRDTGRAYRFFEHLIIEPDEPLGSGLDFGRSSLDTWIAQGRAAAEQALNENPPPV
jgi:NTE family protein